LLDLSRVALVVDDDPAVLDLLAEIAERLAAAKTWLLDDYRPQRHQLFLSGATVVFEEPSGAACIPGGD
jgi:hypothetical protein